MTFPGPGRFATKCGPIIPREIEEGYREVLSETGVPSG